MNLYDWEKIIVWAVMFAYCIGVWVLVAMAIRVMG